MPLTRVQYLSPQRRAQSLLQYTRFVLARSQPAPHGMLSTSVQLVAKHASHPRPSPACTPRHASNTFSELVTKQLSHPCPVPCLHPKACPITCSAVVAAHVSYFRIPSLHPKAPPEHVFDIWCSTLALQRFEHHPSLRFPVIHGTSWKSNQPSGSWFGLIGHFWPEGCNFALWTPPMSPPALKRCTTHDDTNDFLDILHIPAFAEPGIKGKPLAVRLPVHLRETARLPVHLRETARLPVHLRREGLGVAARLPVHIKGAYCRVAQDYIGLYKRPSPSSTFFKQAASQCQSCGAVLPRLDPASGISVRLHRRFHTSLTDADATFHLLMQKHFMLAHSGPVYMPTAPQALHAETSHKLKLWRCEGYARPYHGQKHSHDQAPAKYRAWEVPQSAQP